MSFRLVFVLLLALLAINSAQASDADFVGSATCQSCHQSEFSAWQQSDHFKAMQNPSAETVLGDFNNVDVEFHGIKTHFFKDGELYKVTTLNTDNKQATFTVRYTFGYYPLQQYLLDIGQGKLQAFNIAWDSRTKEQGGQRWYHLQPDENISAKHPFFWQRHFQNWNARCAECHSTNVQKNFDVVSNTFDTQFSEINVACESCHGSGKQHIELANKHVLTPGNAGFINPIPPVNQWRLKPGKTIAESTGKPLHDEINMCGKCHSLRTPVAKDDAPGGFFAKNRIDWVAPPFYNNNGLIKEETFVLGSFLQSKMYAAGVTCANCHNAHTGKVKTLNNGLCLQCHQSSTYDVPQHHKHQPASAGAMCINCHMPDKLYMGVDARRDHSFSIPNFDFDQQSTEPKACLACHDKTDTVWRKQVSENWQSKHDNSLAELHHKIDIGSADVGAAVSAYMNKTQNNPIRQGTILTALASTPSQQSVDLSLQKLSSSDPLIRRAAVESLRVLHPLERWQVLKPLLAENNPVVRFAMAQVLVEALPALTPPDVKQLQELMTDYRYMLSLSAESPMIQLSIANLELNSGNIAKAEAAYLTAVKIEPSYIPVLIQTADFYRNIQQDAKGEQYLQQALQVEPDNADANHAYGLFKIRQKRYQQALPYLKIAADSSEAQANYAYIYAVALDNQQQTFKAIDVLVAADKRWPLNNQIISLLVSYLQKVGKNAEAQQYRQGLKKS